MSTDMVETNGNGHKPTPIAVGDRGVMLTSLEDLYRFSRAVAHSGLAPKGMDKPETIMVAIQLGLELGLSPMAALQNIGVINGRPGIYGDAALALVRQSGLLEQYSERGAAWCDQCEMEFTAATCKCCGVKATAEHRGVIVTSKRKGQQPMVSGFNIRQAKQANLWGKAGPWSQYPNRMLKFRARGFNLRDNFGDVLKGFKTTEELGDYSDVRTVDSRIVEPERVSLPSPVQERTGRTQEVRKRLQQQEEPVTVQRGSSDWAGDPVPTEPEFQEPEIAADERQPGEDD